MMLQGIKHRISYIRVCYGNPPQYMLLVPALDLTTFFEVIFHVSRFGFRLASQPNVSWSKHALEAPPPPPSPPPAHFLSLSGQLQGQMNPSLAHAQKNDWQFCGLQGTGRQEQNGKHTMNSNISWAQAKPFSLQERCHCLQRDGLHRPTAGVRII